jgi:hypothetical protein
MLWLGGVLNRWAIIKYVPTGTVKPDDYQEFHSAVGFSGKFCVVHFFPSLFAVREWGYRLWRRKDKSQGKRDCSCVCISHRRDVKGYQGLVKSFCSNFIIVKKGSIVLKGVSMSCDVGRPLYAGPWERRIILAQDDNSPLSGNVPFHEALVIVS